MIEYWLEQWEELRGRIRAVRFDIQNCKEAKNVDEATGIAGLTGALPKIGGFRIRPKDASDLLAPPANLAEWAREAVRTEVPSSAPPLKVASASVKFPERDGQRLLARTLLTLPRDAGFQPVEEQGLAPSVRLVVEGVVEQEGKPFEEFRMRFILPLKEGEESFVLPVDRLLRPKTNYVVRLRIRDEGSGAEAKIARGFQVPTELMNPLRQIQYKESDFDSAWLQSIAAAIARSRTHTRAQARTRRR